MSRRVLTSCKGYVKVGAGKKRREKMHTPWGESDSKETLAEGIVSYSTPSHGGIWLSAARQAQLPRGLDNFLGSLQWWEEDCDWVVPYIVFKDEIQAYGKAYKFIENLSTAYETARRWHPELFVAV